MDHTIYSKVNGLSVFIRAFKNSSVYQRTFIIAFYFISCRWFGASTFFQNHILQTTWQRNNARLLLICFQKCSACFFVICCFCLTFFSSLCICLAKTRWCNFVPPLV